MTTHKEALTLALEALCTCGPQQKQAITAIKEALAQPEHHTLTSRVNDVRFHKERDEQRAEAMKMLAQPEQEPVAFLVYDPRVQSQELYFDDELGDTDCCEITPLYTTPPQRTWIGLTDEEIYKAGEGAWYMDELDEIIYAKNIEAKLKEKNV